MTLAAKNGHLRVDVDVQYACRGRCGRAIDGHNGHTSDIVVYLLAKWAAGADSRSGSGIRTLHPTTDTIGHRFTLR